MKNSNHRFLMFLLLLLIALPTSLLASIHLSLPSDLVPIDNLQESISKSHRSKDAKLYKRAYGAYQKKDYLKAIQLSAANSKNNEFSDYGYWISAVSYRELAHQYNESEKYDESLSASQKSISMSLKLESSNPYSPFIRDIPKEIAQAELAMGESYWGIGKWKLSQQSFEKGFQRLQAQNSLNQIHPDWIIQYAEACHNKQGPLCLGWLQKLLTQLNKESNEAKEIAKFFPHLEEKVKTPKQSFKSTIGYKASDLDQVAFENAMKLYLEENYSKAAKSLKQFLDDYPRSAHRFRARYWLAQAYYHTKEQENAVKILQDLQRESPLSYYGFLAATASSKPIDLNIRATLPLAIDADPALLPSELFHLKRAEKLLAEKAYELASFELKNLKARDGLSSPFLLYLAMLNYEAKNYNNGFSLVGELIQRGYEGALSSFSLRLIFPINYLDIIKKKAEENELDPILVLSLIKQESAFDEDANSSVGAMGLMQLMFTTAYDMDPNIQAPDLLAAEKNIAIGTKYLRKLLKRFNGNIVYALAGYNAGPNAVDRWIKESGGKKGMLEFIETIPYKETREYVGSIIRNYFWYSRQLNGGTQKTLSYFWNIYGPPENPIKLNSPDPSNKVNSVKSSSGV